MQFIDLTLKLSIFDTFYHLSFVDCISISTIQHTAYPRYSTVNQKLIKFPLVDSSFVANKTHIPDENSPTFKRNI